MHRLFFLTPLLFYLFARIAILPISAQPIRLEGSFIADSTTIGSPTAFVVSILYDSDRTLRLIDSTYQLLPFEWEGMVYFPTQQRGAQYYDSIIYYVSTFELDSVQYLSIPIFEITQQGDTLVHRTPLDSIYLAGLYGIQAPDTPLRTQLAYQQVGYAFDMRLFLFWAGGIVVVLGGLFFLLRKPIRRAWALHRLKRSYMRFERALLGVLERLGSGQSAQLLEEGVQIWKAYAERTSGKAYTKFTTQDIIQENKDMSVILQPIDRIIYGGGQTQAAKELIRQLKHAGRLSYMRQKIKLYEK